MGTRPYLWERANRFFVAARQIAEFEIRPGNTVTFMHEVDLTGVERCRRAAGDARPSYTAFVVKALAVALREFPYANRRLWRSPVPLLGDRLQTFQRCDITVASERDIPGAESIAFVDVCRDADGRSLGDITAWLRALGQADLDSNEQWRAFSTVITRLPTWLATLLIRLPHYLPRAWVRYRGGAALVSSPAKYGADVVATTWPWPLGVSFGLVRRRPAIVGDAVVPRPSCVLTLNFDRRLMAGAQGARFFARLVELLETGEGVWER